VQTVNLAGINKLNKFKNVRRGGVRPGYRPAPNLDGKGKGVCDWSYVDDQASD
jgi:hypothetical protein